MGKPKHDFHLVDPSPMPILAAMATFFMFLGFTNQIHGWGFGLLHSMIGIGTVTAVAIFWWRDVIKEAITDKAHTLVVQKGLSLGMGLFIFSEVMFFFTFFWSFFKAWLDPVMIIEDLWASSAGLDIGWPPEGIQTFDAFTIPFINTLILLLSGTTVTWAHHSMLTDGKDTVKALTITVILGIIFSCLQAVEYMHATFAFAEEGTKAIYSSNFYMATGFHGLHVILGTIFLIVCLFRAKKGHFGKNKPNLCFEFAAWYWHFVDVVWLFLFVFVYWLSA